MPNAKIKPKTKDREATEERILLAAENVFSSLGFNGSTTREIAKKADVNLALITRYFDGKYGLLLKILERKICNLNQVELPHPAQATLYDECKLYAFHRFNTMTEDINIFRIVLGQFLTDPKFLKRFQQDIMPEKFEEIEKRLKRLTKDKKTINQIPTQDVIESINIFIFGLITGHIIIRGENCEDAKIVLENFIRTLTAE